MLENKPAGTFVLQVHAEDADEGANGRVTYGFMHKDSTVPAFSIDPATGTMIILYWEYEGRCPHSSERNPKAFR